MSTKQPSTPSRVKRNLTRPWVVMPAIAVLVLAGFLVWHQVRGTDGSSSSQLATNQTVEVTTGTMADTVSAEGTVAVAESEDLTFSSSGTVTAVNVKAGQTVKEGDILAAIDSTELAATVADAESSVADASAAYTDSVNAGASYEQLQADEASIVTAQNQLNDAYEAYAGAQLIAPFDGTIASVDLTVGEELAGGGSGGTSLTGSGSGTGLSAGTLGDSSSTPGLPTGGNSSSNNSTSGTSSGAIQIVSTSSYVVELALDDTEVAQVEVGQTATVELSSGSSNNGFPGGGGFPTFAAGGFPGGGVPGGGFPGGGGNGGGNGGNTDQAAGTANDALVGSNAASATGTVTEVADIADASSGVATYAVTVTFDDTSGDFNAGASVLVDITVAQVDNVVQVQSFAITTANGTSTVTVVADDGSEEERTVTTGMTAGNMTEITSGLQPGEQVLLALPGGGRFGGAGGGGGGAGGDGGDLPQLPAGVQLPTGGNG